eukprot:TRINITY_DN65245_c0_g1_i1.p1 TRINITY_DN65245_c0_g1~~TRINITY_DN65245_c0_g1_i1.p1  ORF type:complete len:562 (-),score=153.73 TRINITY_DN65245_c0_g1_i1:86-1771(-)
MLKSADLSKILDEDFGDVGFNDPVPELEKPPNETAKGAGDQRRAVGSSFRFPESDSTRAAAVSSEAQGAPSPAVSSRPPAASATASGKAAEAASGKLPKPYERPAVLGAPPLPPEDADDRQRELSAVIDQEARARGYRDANEYNAYCMQESAATEKEQKAEETPLAPGIKKPPAWACPGAYPGDRTKLGKDYQKAVEDGEIKDEDYSEVARERVKNGVRQVYVRQAESSGGVRPREGHTIRFRTEENGSEMEAELGTSGTLPWALEIAALRMKVGDIVEVTGRGDYALAEDDVDSVAERTWRFELLNVSGSARDKFKLDVDERIELANKLRLRGNDQFKRGRLLRAMDLYEKGSQLMDVLEAEDMGMPGGKVDPVAAERNARIWGTQKPLLLNWALILLKLGHYRSAERKCTEVLMDIDKLCVKALFRRGQCNVHLGYLDQARSDLRRAAELDTSISSDVDKEMMTVDRLQKELDTADKGMARKAVKGYFEAGDSRSSAPAPVAAPAAPASNGIIETLQAQAAAAERDGVDEDTYRRQREAIYNSMLFQRPAGGPAEDAAK